MELAGARMELAGARLPLAFGLSLGAVPGESDMTFQATILHEGRPAWRTHPVPVEGTESGADLGDLVMGRFTPYARR